MFTFCGFITHRCKWDVEFASCRSRAPICGFLEGHIESNFRLTLLLLVIAMAEWRNYPFSLSDCNPYIYDSAYFDDLLRRHSKRLCVDDDELHIKIIEVGGAQGRSLSSSA